MKWSDNVYQTKTIAGYTTNWVIQRSSLKRILSSFLAKLKSIFLPSEPVDYTVGMDSTYRPRNDSLTLLEKFFAVAFGLGAVFLFIQYAWMLHDFDRAFRAWLAVAK